MIQVRQNVFETNSSSTHAICIGNDYNVKNLPKHILSYLGEYGWGEDILNSPDELLSYLLTLINSFYYDSDENRDKALNHIFDILKKYDIEVISNGLDESSSYVDHANMGEEFIEQMLDNEDFLMNYLFSPDSFVATGNDNDDSYKKVDKMYEDSEKLGMQVFYKGN